MRKESNPPSKYTYDSFYIVYVKKLYACIIVLVIGLALFP